MTGLLVFGILGAEMERGDQFQLIHIGVSLRELLKTKSFAMAQNLRANSSGRGDFHREGSHLKRANMAHTQEITQ